jgi:hypothetical protein
MVRLKNKVAMDQGWIGFAISLQVNINRILTFKILGKYVQRFTIFDYP